MRALLVIACGTVVDGTGQLQPGSFYQGILHTVTGLDILAHPVFLLELLRSPRQFTHQFKHHRIVLRTLHREADALAVLLPTIEIIEELVHASMKTNIGAEVLEETEEPLMLFVTLVALPDAWDTEHRATFRKKVKHEQVACLHIIHHLWTGILGPALKHPDGFRIDTLHGLHHCLTRLGVIDIRIVVALVEGIHRIIVCLTKEFREFIII